jgi:hypothetical protein
MRFSRRHRVEAKAGLFGIDQPFTQQLQERIVAGMIVIVEVFVARGDGLSF